LLENTTDSDDEDANEGGLALIGRERGGAWDCLMARCTRMSSRLSLSLVRNLSPRLAIWNSFGRGSGEEEVGFERDDEAVDSGILRKSRLSWFCVSQFHVWLVLYSDMCARALQLGSAGR